MNELQERIVAYLEENGPVRQEETAKALYRGDAWSGPVCPECDRKTEDFKEFEAEVTEAFMNLVDRGHVNSTVDWKYEVKE